MVIIIAITPSLNASRRDVFFSFMSYVVDRLQLYFWSNSTVHSIPYLSLNIAKYVPKGLFAIGISTVPPTESPLNILSASSLLPAVIAILDLFSFSFTRPPQVQIFRYSGHADKKSSWRCVLNEIRMYFADNPDDN